MWAQHFHIFRDMFAFYFESTKTSREIYFSEKLTKYLLENCNFALFFFFFVTLAPPSNPVSRTTSHAPLCSYKINGKVKLMTDADSLRHEFRVSTGRKTILLYYDVKCMQNDVMAGILIDLLPVETRNLCLSEASSVIKCLLTHLQPSVTIWSQ